MKIQDLMKNLIVTALLLMSVVTSDAKMAREIQNNALKISISHLKNETIAKVDLYSLLLDVNEREVSWKEQLGKTTAVVECGEAKFNINGLTKPAYAVVSYYDSVLGRAQSQGVTVLPSDSISIEFNDGRLNFSGKLQKVFAAQMEINALLAYSRVGNPTHASDIAPFFARFDGIADSCVEVLRRNRAELGETRYWLLRTYIITTVQSRKLGFLGDQGGFESRIRHNYLQYLKSYHDRTWNSEIAKEFSGNSVVQQTHSYLGFLRDQYDYDSCFLMDRDINTANELMYFSHHCTGVTREWEIYEIVESNYARANDLKRYVKLLLTRPFLSHENIRNYLTDLLNTRMAGAQAFDFSLADTNDKRINLSNMKGDVVLLDFWYIGCGPCAVLHPILDSLTQQVVDSRFRFISICIDAAGQSKAAWISAIKSGKYTSERNQNLVAHTKSTVDSVAINKYMVTGCPTLILIDKAGKIAEQPIDPRVDRGKALAEQLRMELARE